MLQRTEQTPTPKPVKEPSFGEFVALIALMMGITSFAIDNLLPAFDALRADFALSDPNQAQLTIYVYMIAFAFAQLVYGPVSDMAGRRPALLAGLVIFVVGCLIAIVSTNFAMLLFARGSRGSAARQHACSP